MMIKRCVTPCKSHRPSSLINQVIAFMSYILFSIVKPIATTEEYHKKYIYNHALKIKGNNDDTE